MAKSQKVMSLFINLLHSKIVSKYFFANLSSHFEVLLSLLLKEGIFSL